MSSLIAGSPVAELQLVDLTDVEPDELAGFWQRETVQWRETLLWDISAAVRTLRRALARRALSGKAVRSDGQVIGYAYYVVEDARGVLSGLQVAPEWDGERIGGTLLSAVLEDLRSQQCRRIESQFISFDMPWLVSSLEALGMTMHSRSFLRLELPRPRAVPRATKSVVVTPWRSWHLAEAASVMHQAHQDGVDADMNELYRTPEGCRMLLENIIRQRGCGINLSEASATAREPERDRPLGFCLSSEISPRHAHLAQLAVVPQNQQRGVGRALLDFATARLSEMGFESLSLMVSSGNSRAMRLYGSSGFRPIFRFPVFTWSSS